MVERTFTSEMPASAEALFAYHARPGAFERLVPPYEPVSVLSRRGTIRDGDELVIGLRQGPLTLRWVARHEACVEGRQFRDVQISGPFARWVHTHRFEPLGPERSRLVDALAYALPGDPLASWVAGGWVVARLDRMFAYRHRRTALDLRRQVPFAHLGARRIALAGELGPLGPALSAFLSTAGHRVGGLAEGPEVVFFQPAALGEPPLVQTRRVVAALAEGREPPRQAWLLWPAEASAPEAGLAACETAWRELGPGARVVRVARLLAPASAWLQPAAPRPLGKLEWIALDDAVGALHHLACQPERPGEGLALVAPEPAPAEAFLAALAAVARRGPRGSARRLAEPVLSSAALGASGFRFVTPTLEAALRAEWGVGHFSEVAHERSFA